MAQEQTATPKKRTFNFETFMVGVGIFLVEILVPALVTGGVLFWLSGTINLWKMDRNMAISAFAVIFVLLTLIITTVLSEFLSRLQKKKNPRLRLAVMIIGGLVIPIGIFSGANLLYIGPGESYMARLINISLNQTVDVSMVQLGTTIIKSTSPYTKVQGINAIDAIHSPTGMEQLFQILNTDSESLTNVQVANALSQAIASYGTDAKPGLISAFQAHLKSTQTTNLPSDLYDRYFAQSITALQAEINAQSLNAQTKQAELQQVSGLATQLQSELDGIQSASLLASGADPVLDFVLNTFLQMNITQDGDVYALAGTTASNTTLPDSVRGKALLLLAKLGGKDDMSLLYQYLQNNSEIIKADTFAAIANLTQKLNGTNASK
jgi:hypothetical protein